jgi:hypothetical protein
VLASFAEAGALGAAPDGPDATSAADASDALTSDVGEAEAPIVCPPNCMFLSEVVIELLSAEGVYAQPVDGGACVICITQPTPAGRECQSCSPVVDASVEAGGRLGG